MEVRINSPAGSDRRDHCQQEGDILKERGHGVIKKLRAQGTENGERCRQVKAYDAAKRGRPS